MTATPSQICWVAGHAWQDKQDQWGKWRECARCGTVVSASGWLPNRRVTPGLSRPPNTIIGGLGSRVEGQWWQPDRWYPNQCGRWIYHDEVGPGKPRCVLPLGHEGWCSEIPRA